MPARRASLGTSVARRASSCVFRILPVRNFAVRVRFFTLHASTFLSPVSSRVLFSLSLSRTYFLPPGRRTKTRSPARFSLSLPSRESRREGSRVCAIDTLGERTLGRSQRSREKPTGSSKPEDSGRGRDEREYKRRRKKREGER